jgi:hypothetical protein
MIISKRNTSQIINDDICVSLNLFFILCFVTPAIENVPGRVGQKRHWSQIRSSRLGGYNWLCHRIVVPARQATLTDGLIRQLYTRVDYVPQSETKNWASVQCGYMRHGSRVSVKSTENFEYHFKAVPTLYHTYCTSVPRYRKPSEATLYCMAATMMFCSDASILEHEKNAILENWRRIHECTISLRLLGNILRVLRLEVFLYNVYITNQFQTTKGGREEKSVSRSDCK